MGNMKKYRVGRKNGIVILETETSKEVARATTEEMAKNICKLLNHQSQVNNGVLDDVIKCDHKFVRSGDSFDLTVYCSKCGKEE